MLGYTKTFEDPSDYAHMAMPDKATKSETEFSLRTAWAYNAEGSEKLELLTCEYMDRDLI